eukprot:5064940-Amphidinium_carterae.1
MSATAASFAGRLNFLKSLCLGRRLTLVMYMVHARAAAGGLCRITFEEAAALDAIAMPLPMLPPRLVPFSPTPW